MEARTLPADYLALADIGLPGGRSGLSLLQDLAGTPDDEAVTLGLTYTVDVPGWIGAVLDMGGCRPPGSAKPETA